MTSLAEAQALDGSIAEALGTIDQALQANPDERAFRPETLTLRGELRREQGQAEAAAADFREAIALAQEMGAKGWELRASLSLARLWRSQGEDRKAREMLTVIYSWFTEGLDTRDVIDAEALLQEL